MNEISFLKGDYHKTEEGYEWFKTESALLLLRENTKGALPKIKGTMAVRCQYGAFRIRFWALKRVDGGSFILRGAKGVV